MQVKQKFVYECVCDRCGKKDLLDTPPVMVSIFKCRKEYLCKSCLKNFLSEAYDGEWNNDKEEESDKVEVDERSFIIKIGDYEETIDISIKNKDSSDELSSLENIFIYTIESLIYKDMIDKNIMYRSYILCRSCFIFGTKDNRYASETEFLRQVLELMPGQTNKCNLSGILRVQRPGPGHSNKEIVAISNCIVKRIK